MALRYFLACWIAASCLVSGAPLTYGLLGQKVHLQPHIIGHPDDIRWKHDGSDVVKFNGKEERVNSDYHSRVTLDWVSAELDITDLRYEDSGSYELETYVNNEMHRFQYTLEVIDKVTKPSVSCEMNSSDTRGAWATLTCSAEPTQRQSLMKFEWESGGNVLPGPKLTILLEDEPDDKIYTCRVSNPLTFETTTFAAKTCSSVKSSSVALAVSLSLIFLFLLLLLLAVVFCKLKNKACFAKSNRDDVEKRPSSTEERDPDDEKAPCLDRATTLPSNQRLRSLVRAPSDTDHDLPADHHREHEAADLDKGEESKKEEDEIEDEKSLANGLSPPSLPLTLNSPDKGTEVTAGEYEDDANSDQVIGETESHSPNLEKSTEPDESTEEDRPSTASEHNTSETASLEHLPTLSEEETHAKEDDQPEMDKTVSGENRESAGEENKENLYSDTSQSPTPKNTDTTQTNTLEKSPNADLPHPDPQVEGESSHDSDCEEQSDTSAAEEDSDESIAEEDQPSTSPEPNMPETASGEHQSQLSEGETRAKQDDQPEKDKTVSGDNRESAGEETEKNLYSDTSQSPTPKDTDTTQTDTLEKSPNAALPDPDPQVEGESSHDSDCEGQSDSSAAEEDDGEGKTEEDQPSTSPEPNMPKTASGEHHSKGQSDSSAAKEEDGEGKTKEKTKGECDPQEEKPDNKSKGEDKEGQKKAEAVEK